MQEDKNLKNLKNKFKFMLKNDKEEKEYVVPIDIELIMPNPYQPRRRFEVSALNELAQSINEVGVITPITVRKAPGGYELVCGERRLRAAKMAGLKKIPAIISDLSDKESAIIALTENLQRKELSFFEEAESMQSLIEFHELTQERVAEKLGISQGAVANKLRLLKLSDSVRHIINEGNLCERHARAFLRLPTEQMQIAAAKRCAEMNMNVSATEKMVQRMLEEEPKKKILSIDRNKSFEMTSILFRNTLEKTLDVLKKNGFSTKLSEKSEENYVEYTIKLER